MSLLAKKKKRKKKVFFDLKKKKTKWQNNLILTPANESLDPEIPKSEGISKKKQFFEIPFLVGKKYQSRFFGPKNI